MATVLLVADERELGSLDSGFRAAGFGTALADSGERGAAIEPLTVARSRGQATRAAGASPALSRGSATRVPGSTRRRFPRQVTSRRTSP
jgi:hypothetical protein